MQTKPPACPSRVVVGHASHLMNNHDDYVNCDVNFGKKLERLSCKARVSFLLVAVYLLCSLSFKLNETHTSAVVEAAEQVQQQPSKKSSSSSSSSSSSGGVIFSACKDGLDFDSLAEFETFIAEFKSKSEEELQLERVPTACIKYRRAILELESLIVRESVCDIVQIDALIKYHKKYFKSRRGLKYSSDWNPLKKVLKSGKPVITRKFFSKYAIEVAHTCKRNLLANLETSRQLLYEQAKSIEEAKERVFKERPSLKMNIKLIEEQPDAPATTNVKPRSETEVTLGEYREALTRLKRPEDILTFERSECRHLSNRYVEIAADKIQMFFKPALVCLKLAQYYSGSVLSIARLANHGYVAKDDELDLKLADSQLVKDWIVATQVCEPMLYMRTDKTENDVARVDTCSERVLAFETMVFEDKLEDLSERDKLEEWLLKSEATRHQAQKIMKSAMRKLAKESLMRELSRAGKLKKRNMFSVGTIKNIMSAAAQAASAQSAGGAAAVSSRQMLAQNMMRASIDVSSLDGQHSDAKSFEVLMKIMSEEGANAKQTARSDDNNSAGEDSANSDGDGAVAFEPLTSLASTVTIIAIMLTFEWLFFVVMTLAARICQRLNFNFDNLLTFPPKVLSWSDADFTKYTETLDNIDEDDFFDYDELNPEEQKQRNLLAKVFGKPPPLLYKE